MNIKPGTKEYEEDQARRLRFRAHEETLRRERLAMDAAQRRVEQQARGRREAAALERQRIEADAAKLAEATRREEIVRRRAGEILSLEPGGVPATFPKPGEKW